MPTINKRKHCIEKYSVCFLKKEVISYNFVEKVNTNKMWYALTEYIWGSTKELPKTRANTMIEEGWIIVNTDDQRQNVMALCPLMIIL